MNKCYDTRRSANKDLYQVSLKHDMPQQVGEKSEDYFLRSNKHVDVVCASFAEALSAAQTGQHDYVITGVRRVGSVIVVRDCTTVVQDELKVGNKATPDIDVKVSFRLPAFADFPGVPPSTGC